MIEINFDGACEPFNPGGTASYGYLIKKNNKIIKQGSGIIGKGEGMTSNVAEYHALIEGIKAFNDLNIKEKVIIRGDSKLVCYIISKEWGWNKKKTEWNPHKDCLHLKKLLDKALEVLKDVDYEIEFVKRENNQEADILSKEPLIENGVINNEELFKNKKKIKTKISSKNEPRKYKEGDKCPKGCGGNLLWVSGEVTQKRLKKAYHFEKWLKCNMCKSIFFDGKYKVLHNLNSNKKLF